jgi:hypothetical protein
MQNAHTEAPDRALKALRLLPCVVPSKRGGKKSVFY